MRNVVRFSVLAGILVMAGCGDPYAGALVCMETGTPVTAEGCPPVGAYRQTPVQPGKEPVAQVEQPFAVAIPLLPLAVPTVEAVATVALIGLDLVLFGKVVDQVSQASTEASEVNYDPPSTAYSGSTPTIDLSKSNPFALNAFPTAKSDPLVFAPTMVQTPASDQPRTRTLNLAPSTPMTAPTAIPTVSVPSTTTPTAVLGQGVQVTARINPIVQAKPAEPMWVHTNTTLMPNVPVMPPVVQTSTMNPVSVSADAIAIPSPATNPFQGPTFQRNMLRAFRNGVFTQALADTLGRMYGSGSCAGPTESELFDQGFCLGVEGAAIAAVVGLVFSTETYQADNLTGMYNCGSAWASHLLERNLSVPKSWDGINVELNPTKNTPNLPFGQHVNMLDVEKLQQTGNYRNSAFTGSVSWCVACTNDRRNLTIRYMAKRHYITSNDLSCREYVGCNRPIECGPRRSY